MDIVAPSGLTASPHTHAIIYKNGCRLFVPRYDRRFVQALKNLVPPKARVFHGGHNASYTILAPWHEQAVALANEFFLDFTRHHTDEPYSYPGDDRHLVLGQRRKVGGR